MSETRQYAVWPLGLALLVCSCGNYTPPDAVVKPIEGDRTSTYTLVTTPVTVVDGAIHFKVSANANSTAPVGGANVELSGTSPSTNDLSAGFIVSGTVGSGFVNSSDPNHIQLTTDSSGVVTVFYQFTVPKCNTTDDIAATATITAFTGSSTSTWTDTITVTKDPTC
jgi:hypothetical protein